LDHGAQSLQIVNVVDLTMEVPTGPQIQMRAKNYELAMRFDVSAMNGDGKKGEAEKEEEGSFYTHLNGFQVL
jgi:hypothetical protein